MPTLFAGSGWTSVQAGGCGTLNGQLLCWDARGVGGMVAPSPVNAATDWSQVALGGGHSCGLASGKLFCWGNNQQGQLGDATNMARSSPTQIGTDADWSQVAAGSTYACGLRGGSLFCWGSNDEGQLGDSSRASRNAPVQIGSGSDWSTVAAGLLHTCGIRSGALYCWGRNGDSEVGDGTDVQRLSPLRVGNASDWSTVALGRPAAYVRASCTAGAPPTVRSSATGSGQRSAALPAWATRPTGARFPPHSSATAACAAAPSIAGATMTSARPASARPGRRHRWRSRFRSVLIESSTVHRRQQERDAARPAADRAAAAGRGRATAGAAQTGSKFDDRWMQDSSGPHGLRTVNPPSGRRHRRSERPARPVDDHTAGDRDSVVLTSRAASDRPKRCRRPAARRCPSPAPRPSQARPADGERSG